MNDEIELFLVTGISFISMIAYQSAITERIKNNKIFNVLFEFTLWIMPQYIVIIYPDQLIYMYLFLFTIIVTNFNNLKSNIYLNEKTNVVKNKSTDINNNIDIKKNDTNNNIEIKQNGYNDNIDIKQNDNKDIMFNETQNTIKNKITNKNHIPVMDSYSAYLILMVIISIFACDFSFFPERFLKTEFYGLSLMDIGIGSFLFNNGVFSINIKRNKLCKTVVTLGILGFIRLGTLVYFNYYVNITEYGKHMNFYYVLGITYCLFYIVNSKHNFKLALIISLAWEYLLRIKKYDIFIFEEKRHTWFLCNKEGLFQIIPSLTIFLFSSEIGKIAKMKISNKEKLIRLFRYTALFIFIYLFCKEYSIASRRLGNITYISWIVGLHSLHVLLSVVAGHMVNFKPLKLHTFVSNNMMLLFLLSNLIILIVNLLANVRVFTTIISHGVMIMYLFIIFIIPYSLLK